MACYQREQWEDYYHGLTSESERLAMTEHLAGCSYCREQYLTIVDGNLYPAPAGLMVEVQRKLWAARAEAVSPRPRRERPRRHSLLVQAYAMAASVLLLLSSTGLLQRILPQSASGPGLDLPQLCELRLPFTEQGLNNPFYNLVRQLPEVKVQLPSWGDNRAQQK